MLERLRIVDFQAHEDLRVQLDPRVTVVVGPSNVGKSSVVRALRWLLTNKPRGDSFVREGCRQTKVTLWVDGHKIARSKGSENLYGLDGKVYKSFGNDVPADVAQLLNVSEVNCQGQHDAPFWLSLTPGEVARQLNEIVDLGVIDRVHGHLASRLRKATATRDVVQDRLEEAVEQVERSQHVLQMDEELQELEEMQKRIDVKKAMLLAIDNQIRQLDAAQRSVRDVPDTGEMDEQFDRLKQTQQDVVVLTRLITQLRAAQTVVEQLGGQVEEMEAELAELGDVCPTCGRPWEGDHDHASAKTAGHG